MDINRIKSVGFRYLRTVKGCAKRDHVIACENIRKGEKIHLAQNQTDKDKIE